jgi:hypothetical protein
LESEQKEIQDGVMRVLLECLYDSVGWVSEYLKDPEGRGKPPPGQSKKELVEVAAGKIGIEQRHCRFLIGEGSNFWQLNRVHHQYSMRIAAIHLERIVE